MDKTAHYLKGANTSIKDVEIVLVFLEESQIWKHMPRRSKMLKGYDYDGSIIILRTTLERYITTNGGT